MKKNMDRKFGHCIVKWRVENYFILAKNRTWQIISPEFEVRGFKTTRWVMILTNKQIDDKFQVLFKLQSLNSGEKSEDFIGNCSLTISNDFGKFTILQDDFFFSAENSNEKTIKVHLDNATHTTNSYDLCIVCKLFIRFINVEEETKVCSNIGILELSRDLFRLFENEQDNDVILVVIDTIHAYNIKAHKFILQCRNKKLQKMFNTNKNSTKFIVDHFGHHKEWMNILRFFYTANMKYVLDPPSQIYYDISLIYDIKPITHFYQPDELILNSTIPIEEFTISWTVGKFLERREICLQSRKLQNKALDTYWQVNLYPRSFQKEDETCICVEVEGRSDRFVLVEISAMNIDKQDCLGKIYGEISNNTIFKGYSFVKRKILNEYLQNGNLTLGFRLLLVNSNFLNECKQRSDKSIVICKPYSDENNYSTLSADMSTLHYDGNVCDKLNFLLAEGECFIHRCVLAARAPILYEKVKESKIVKYQKTKQCILTDLIYFLYCGKYKSVRYLDDTFALYEIADFFNIRSLRHFLLYNISFNMCMLNVDELQKVLQFGKSKNLPSLLTSVRRLIQSPIIKD